MTLEEKLKDVSYFPTQDFNYKMIRLKNALTICQQEIDEACKKQRLNAIDMANALCRITLRYNTVVSSEAIAMEFKEVFNKYFPSPKESE